MIEVFTDQAYNLIRLAEDEARMLGRTEVEPKHVLLALTRHGNVESLLAERVITGADIYRAISHADGIGDELLSGSLQRSASTEEAMRRAFDAAAQRCAWTKQRVAARRLERRPAGQRDPARSRRR